MSIIKAANFVAYATVEAKLVQNKPDPKVTDSKTDKKPVENEDLRIRRTRKLIQQAFIELTVEQGFSTITVQDIADRAMINRSTFYRHYLDKYDLLNKYMDDVYAMTSEEEFLADKLRINLNETPTGLLSLLKHIEKHADFYHVMLGPKGDASMVQRLRKNTERRFQNMFASHPVEVEPDSPPLELRISYVSYAGVGAIKWWVENQRPCTTEQLARWLGQLGSACVGLTLQEYLRRANSVSPSEGNGTSG